jgi:hypothetical protein
MDWLDTYWHFSFDDYHDPHNVHFGHLRVFNDDRIKPNSGFGMHPHQEMEIITYVLEGTLTHEDNMGNQGTIQSGEVQRMSAGTGIRHSEYNHSQNEPVHLMQIWVLPDQKGLTPGWEQKKFTLEQRRQKLFPIASGQKIGEGVRIHQDTTFYVSALDPGEKVIHQTHPDRRIYTFVIQGQVRISEKTLSEGDQLRITEISELTFVAEKPTELILIDLP